MEAEVVETEALRVEAESIQKLALPQPCSRNAYLFTEDCNSSQCFYPKKPPIQNLQWSLNILLTTYQTRQKLHRKSSVRQR